MSARFSAGSGGNNHALERYHVTFNPLVVKLGTITPSGADVFSYDEDDMVEDPNLAEHLAYLGINMMTQTKVSLFSLSLSLSLSPPPPSLSSVLCLTDRQDNDRTGD